MCAGDVRRPTCLPSSARGHERWRAGASGGRRRAAADGQTATADGQTAAADVQTAATDRQTAGVPTALDNTGRKHGQCRQPRGP